jgi:hypothetical protein
LSSTSKIRKGRSWPALGPSGGCGAGVVSDAQLHEPHLAVAGDDVDGRDPLHHRAGKAEHLAEEVRLSLAEEKLGRRVGVIHQAVRAQNDHTLLGFGHNRLKGAGPGWFGRIVRIVIPGHHKPAPHERTLGEVTTADSITASSIIARSSIERACFRRSHADRRSIRSAAEIVSSSKSYSNPRRRTKKGRR